MTWKPAKSSLSSSLSIRVNPNHTTLKELQNQIASTCAIALSGIDKTISKAGQKGISAIDWQASIPNDQNHPKAHPFHLAEPDACCCWIEWIANKPVPRLGAVFVSQQNPQKKDKAHHENLIAKTNHWLNVRPSSSHQVVAVDKEDTDSKDNSSDKGLVIVDAKHSTCRISIISMVFTLSTPILLWLILIQPMLQNTYP
jgi:hypothetical protein